MPSFLNQVCTGRKLVRAWFLEIALSAMSVCVCVGVSALKAINYTHVILNLYNQLKKFVAFRNVTKLSMHRLGLCDEAHHDRNQSNKAMLAP